MKYTPKEKYILDSIQKTDFKNLSKNDMISFSSKIEELRPEVAKEILAKFPEFVSLIKSALTEYKRMIDKIIDSFLNWFSDLLFFLVENYAFAFRNDD